MTIEINFICNFKQYWFWLSVETIIIKMTIANKKLYFKVKQISFKIWQFEEKYFPELVKYFKLKKLEITMECENLQKFM